MVKSLDDRIEDLIRTIRDDSKAEIEDLESEAKKRESQIIAKAQIEAEQIRSNIISTALVSAKAIKEEVFAESELALKRKYQMRREKLIEQVFDRVRSTLPDLIDRPEYAQALPGLIKESIQQLGTTEAILHLDEKSHKLIISDQLSAMASSLEMKVAVGDDLSSGFGVIAFSPEGHRVIDNTLGLRLERQKSQLRMAVFEILMGDKK
jgi:vacuolar-type H+-ATPase subunit E/Vma4